MAKVLHRAREDDFVECFLFPKFCYESNNVEVSEASLLEEIKKFNQEIGKYKDEYMWHRDPLVFSPKTRTVILLDKELESTSNPEEEELPPHIHTILRFDEDVGDEWFVVFLVFELTKAFDGLVARVMDSDGEFLLIEAADVLPAWASPQICNSRVFISNGKVHVVQGKQKTTSELLGTVHERPKASEMSEEVQAAVRKRLSIYPEEKENRMHKARVYLPERAVSILKQEPGLVAAAVRAVCHSDPIERKVCRAMRYFPPEQRAMVNVRMTKCLYAMASHCRYMGDPRTGWNLPPATDPRYSAHLLGVKIACGLEMLVAQANDERRQRGRGRTETEEANEGAGAMEGAWNAYLARLEASGYFRDLLEGSQEREKLYCAAREYFTKHSDFSDSSPVPRESEAGKVLDAWRAVQTCDFELQASSQTESNLSPPDGDSWLTVDPEQLEAMLGQHWAPSDEKPEQEPLTLREKVQAFLTQTSDVDGVQFPGEQEAEERKAMQEDNGRIEFEVAAFDCALRDILDLVVPGAEDEFEGSSDDSLGGEEEEKGGELDKYMRLLDLQLQRQMQVDGSSLSGKANEAAVVEENLRESVKEEAGGAGPAGNIIGGPIRRLMHLQLQSPSAVPSDLQS